MTTDYVTYAPIVQDLTGITFTHTHDLGDPDPQFTAPGSDYTLKPTSPLIDQDPTALTIFESPTDLAGNTRLVDGERDIGAYERPDPTATTAAATAVTQTAATLSGSANEGGAAGGGSAQLVYGTTAAYGQALATQALPVSAGAVAITGAPSGLTPSTTYHYALKVQTPLGTVTSADRTFTTTSPATGPPGGGTNPPGGGTNPPGGKTGAPKTIPVIRSLSLSPSKFKAARSGSTLATPPKKRAPGGATLTISLNVAATVTFTVTRQDRGVRKGKTCARARARAPREVVHPRGQAPRLDVEVAQGGHHQTALQRADFEPRAEAGRLPLDGDAPRGKAKTVKFAVKR